MKADALSKFASSEKENYVGSVYFQVLKTPSINGKLIAPIDIGGFWIDLIKAHLETGWLPNNASEARKLTVRALRALAHKITRLGFYWPNMIANAKDYVKKCERCQKHAHMVRKPPEMLTSVNSPIPFVIWDMDVFGPFLVASAQRKFLIVVIDYFTKWIEAKPLAKIITKQVLQFL
ncbi:hypothetical protein POM88_037685 [Heracleum sosnowskyi]|uniref:Integrase catalytic domain-containing protein n=1 Tax=Heracleum sosnowskyi TaxID=360622 RepID=A0AAD8HSM9_9APIA|nr:hypothetical protein POM88_037685 [Heracleum sosnowskyi]